VRVLISWIDLMDLKYAEEGRGPVLQALEAIPFDGVILLDNYKNKDRAAQLEVFRGRVGERPNLCYRHFEVENPNEHKTIFKIARQVVDEARAKWREAKLTFHLSPGTPAMMLAWVLLAPSHGAALIESSAEHGVQKVDLPFEIAAAFLPDS